MKARIPSTPTNRCVNAWTTSRSPTTATARSLYVNGELVDNGRPNRSYQGRRTPDRRRNDIGDYFDGRLDEVRIYDRALDRRRSRPRHGRPGILTPKPGPVAAYSFDEKEGTTVEDLTGDGHTADDRRRRMDRWQIRRRDGFNGEDDCL